MENGEFSIYYKVKGGDTLRGIAERFCGDSRKYMELWRFNKGDHDTGWDVIHPGEVFLIPSHLCSPWLAWNNYSMNLHLSELADKARRYDEIMAMARKMGEIVKGMG